jgi:hypothetical protein
MSPEIPPAPPEADVIRLARKAADMTAESAAEATRTQDGRGISASYWRDVERGHGGRRGKQVPVRASDRALAAMARVVGVTPGQLAGAGREDAARVLGEVLRRESPPPVSQPPRDSGLDSFPFPMTVAARAAAERHLPRIMDRLEVARAANPGRPVSGEMMFPADVPDAGARELNARDAEAWDLMSSYGMEPESAATFLAVMKGDDQDTRRRQGNSSAAGLARR